MSGVQWWRIEMDHAVFAVRVERGVVTQAAPIAGWMVNRPWSYCRRWIKSKGGHGAPLSMKGIE